MTRPERPPSRAEGKGAASRRARRSRLPIPLILGIVGVGALLVVVAHAVVAHARLAFRRLRDGRTLRRLGGAARR